MLALFSGVIALACILASARRLRWALAPTSLDPETLASALRDASGPRRGQLLTALRDRLDLGWEHELAATMASGDVEGAVGEGLLELDWAVERWARVPRVCASISTSAGFLFACIAVLGTLAGPDEGVPVTASLLPALDALAVGIAGTAFCIAAHLRARRGAAAQRAAHERLVVLLEEEAMGRAVPLSAQAIHVPAGGEAS